MNKYWRKRLEAEMKAREQDDISLTEAMTRLHDYHYRSIEKEIESFYQRYADKEKIDLTEARKQADEIDVSAYQKKAQDLVARADKMRKAGKIVTKADFTHQENADMAIYNLMMKVNRLELLQYNIDLAMQELADDEYELHKKFLEDGFEQEKAFRAGIMVDTVPNPKAIVDIAQATINANFKGASWSKSIWERQNKLRSIVAQEVYQAIVRGQNGLTIARNLRKSFDVNSSYAKRLAITEHARVQMEVAKQSMLRNGFEYYEVLPEPKACDICRPKAGKKYRVDKMVTGETAPPFHPYCRCAIVEVFEDVEEPKEIELKHAENITKKFLENAVNQSALRILTEYTKNGKTYKVDGHNVVNDHSNYEYQVASWLAETTGANVDLVPRVNFPEKTPTPDFLINDEPFDLKEVTGSGKYAIDNNARKTKIQSPNIIFDITKNPLSEEEILKQLDDVYWSERRELGKTILKKEDKIIGVFDKK
ncbi:minor capsid protein [Streptococcus thoraltensis]|uniref:minor capsid protein n=1 Tax=Streptococcus thoraltensis TaxID=55085 RepID=UPI001F58940E|nr:minor capsid protein [Streptococcus thoraltensis]